MQVCRILDKWNSEIPLFPDKFPNFNTKSFMKQYKYWIHWIRKMDPREKLIFKDFNPYILINEEDWVHLDLSKKEVPIIYYSYYFPDSKWLPIVMFKSIEHLQSYIRIPDATSDTLIAYIHSEKLSKTKERINEENDGFPKLIFDGDSIRLAHI